MKINLMVDMFRLAFSKGKFSQKVSYLLQGIVFMPFLVYEGIKQQKEGQSLADGNQTGDDVYPLF